MIELDTKRSFAEEPWFGLVVRVESDGKLKIDFNDDQGDGQEVGFDGGSHGARLATSWFRLICSPTPSLGNGRRPWYIRGVQTSSALFRAVSSNLSLCDT